MALVLSLLFLLLLRLVAGPLVLVLILGVLGVLAYGIYHCWKEYQVLRDQGASITQLGFTTNLSAYRSVQETWLVAREYPAPPNANCQGLPWPDRPSALSPSVIVLAVLEGLLLLMLIFLRQRIRIAIALLKEASKSGPTRDRRAGGRVWPVGGWAGAGPAGEGQSSAVVNAAVTAFLSLRCPICEVGVRAYLPCRVP